MAAQEPVYRDLCRKCGAQRLDEQIGLEKTPEEYVAKLVAVFRAVRRVLRDDGTLWLNLGDSYAAGKAGRTDHGSNDPTSRLGPNQDGIPGGTKPGPVISRRPPPGLKPKDLVGIPWMVAFALRADGWYLRSDIIWHKTNPMPESVTDRPTKSHEYLFLLSKSPKYFCDMDAIKEPAKDSRGGLRFKDSRALAMGRVASGNEKPENYNTVARPKIRNKRTVWTISSAPFKGAHFATFPPKLIEPCILAGAPTGGWVLDPFNGAGTTGLVAARHGRQYIGIDLNAAYCAMSDARLAAA